MNKTRQMSETIRLGMLLAVSGGFNGCILIHRKRSGIC